MLNPYLLMKISRSLKGEKHNDLQESKPQLLLKKRKTKYKKGSICRVCLKDNGSICLNSVNNEGLDIPETLMLCGDINVQDDDITYPKHLCSSCYDSLLKAYQFRLLAKQSDSLLKTTIKEEVCDQKDEILPRKLQQDEKDKEMEEHYDVVEKESLYTKRKVKCKLCNKILTAMYFKSHLISMHYKQYEKTHVCEICGKSYRQLGSLSIHMKQHSNEFPYLCSSCPFRAKYKNLLAVHMRQHTGNKKFMCSECPSRYYTASNLSRHMKTHMEPQYKCDYCGRPYRCKDNLNRHIEVEHLGIRKKFTCTVCGNEYTLKQQLYRHEIRKHGRKKNNYSRMPSYLKVQNVEMTKEYVSNV